MKHTSNPREVKESKEVNWIMVSNGYIALRSKPGLDYIHYIKDQTQCTTILTLISEKEGAQQIGKKVTSLGLNWIWLPLRNADPPANNESFNKIADVILQMKDILLQGGSILIHCAAGIHRTGMIANILLRYLEYDRDRAIQTLQECREVTGLEVGKARLDVAHRFIKNFGTVGNPITPPLKK